MNKKIKLLLITDMWLILALGLLGPIYALFVQDIGGDILDASWAFFIFTFTSGFLIFFSGKYEDKIKHKEKLIVVGYVFASLGIFSYLFVSNQYHLFAAQVLLGISGAILIPAYDAVYSRALDRNKEASEWASYEAFYRIVTAFAAVAGGYVVYLFGFKTLISIMFVASLIATASSFRLLRKMGS